MFYGVNESGKTSLMEVISWMIASPPSGLKSNYIFGEHSFFECSLTFTVFNRPSIIWMMAYTMDDTLYDARHLLDTPLRTDMKLTDGLAFQHANGQYIFDYDLIRRFHYHRFQQENILNIDELLNFSIFTEWSKAKNSLAAEKIEFIVSETLKLLREVCPPTNQFGKIVHSVNNTHDLNQALKARGENSRLLVNFTYRLLNLINECRNKSIRLPIIIDDLPFHLSDDYLHLMAKVIQKSSRICQIIATTADPQIAKVLKENNINIIDMTSCKPA